MVSIYDVALYAGLIAGVAWLYKRGKGKLAGVKVPMVGLAAAALLVVAFIGGAFAPILSALSVQPGAGPVAGAQWDVVITAATVATAAETAVISKDSHTVDLYSGLANWQTVASNDDIVLTFTLINKNAGQTTDQFTALGKVTAMPQPSGGTGTSFIVLKDGNGLWDVVYAGYSTGYAQPRDELSVTVAAAGTDASITGTFEANAAGFDNFQLAGNYAMGFSMGGIALTVGFHVTGA